MKFKRIKEHRFFRPAAGATLAALCGLGIWLLFPDGKWSQASYDTLFRFGSRSLTNQVVLVFMDNEAFAELEQSRDRPWDRSLHARFLNKLADDGCPLVAMDILFRQPGDAKVDQTLIAAMARLSNVVLAAEQSGVTHPGLESVRPTLPLDSFLLAARTNWGVAWLDSDLDMIVRRHWPFPNPGPSPSLPWKVAQLSGARLSDESQERWIRYYNFDQAWSSISYHLALTKGPGYFHDKTVFIGAKPKTALPDSERDEFRSPQFSWTGETVGGVEILATSYLNLVKGDWLRRPPWVLEGLLFLVTGTLVGGVLARFHYGKAIAAAIVAVLAFTIVGIGLSFLTNFWVPWLIVVGGQVPCALAWAMFLGKIYPAPQLEAKKVAPQRTIVLSFPEEPLPDAPEYELFNPPIGKGGFGKVWIARNAIGQWQALKAVYQSNFGDNRGPYEMEFKGLQRYKPVSEKHPGLLRIELVSKMKPEGYFYYVMELGDAQTPGWETQPTLYKPRDLENIRKQSKDKCLPVRECWRIVTILADALNFLHQQGLTHRDIKPSNVVFVNGRPKLADVGLVADIRPLDQMKTMIGTLGYMPPPPEQPGTAQADIYALGMVLYVISTGCDPCFFSEISTTLRERSVHAEFTRLNLIILKACQPDLAQRYKSTTEMLSDLQAGSKELGLN